MHELVVEAAAVATPHDILGYTPYAYIVIRKDAPSSEDQIIDELKALMESRIVKYGLPTHYLVFYEYFHTMHLNRSIKRKRKKNLNSNYFLQFFTGR